MTKRWRRQTAGEQRKRRPRLRILAVVVALIVLFPVVSLSRAVFSPGTDSASAKAAEWARGHGLGFAVTAAEELVYKLNPPATGGTPDPSLLAPPVVAPSANSPSQGGAGSGANAKTRTASGRQIRPRVPMSTLAQPPLPGEGVFQTVVNSSRGPAVQLARLRPDRIHTSYLAAVTVLSHGAVRFVQHPGYDQPGQLHLWRQADVLTPAHRNGLAATFQ